MSRPREFDTEAVVDAALQAFWVRGWTGCSVSDLQEATGLSRASLYGAFGDKEGLLRAAIESYIARFLARLAERRRDQPPLRAFLLTTIDVNDTGGGGCFVTLLSAEGQNLPPGARAQVLDAIASTERVVRQQVAEARERCEIDPDRDPEEVAALVGLVQRGIGTIARQGAPRADLERRMDQFIALLGR